MFASHKKQLSFKNWIYICIIRIIPRDVFLVLVFYVEMDINTEVNFLKKIYVDSLLDTY